METLWRINSGKCAGFKVGNRMYDVEGDNIGHFRGNIVYLLNGEILGEIYQGKYIGLRETAYPAGFSYSPYISIDVEEIKNIEGIIVDGWKDPDFKF